MSTTIEPRIGAGPFRFGMTRDEAWSETQGVITSFLPYVSTERMDDFRDFAIHSEYEAGVIVRLVAFTSNRPYINRSVLSLFDQTLGPEADRGDVVALLELQGLPYVEGRERIDVPDLGLTFGFVEQGENDDERLGWISVEVAGASNRSRRGPPMPASSFLGSAPPHEGQETTSLDTTIIEPRVGAGPFRFGMTRDQTWAATRSAVTSFFPYLATERMDDFRPQAIHCEYEAGVCVRATAFTSNHPYCKRCTVSLFEQELGPEADWDDILTLLELQELSYVEGRERIDVPDLGLTFGFMERGEEEALRLEWISVEAAGRKEPFTKGPPNAG